MAGHGAPVLRGTISSPKNSSTAEGERSTATPPVQRTASKKTKTNSSCRARPPPRQRHTFSVESAFFGLLTFNDHKQRRVKRDFHRPGSERSGRALSTASRVSAAKFPRRGVSVARRPRDREMRPRLTLSLLTPELPEPCSTFNAG